MIYCEFSPLRRDIGKLVLVLRVDLRPKRCHEYELSDRACKSVQADVPVDETFSGNADPNGDLPSKESIERKAADNNAVQELRDARQHYEDEESVDELEALGGIIKIRCPESLECICGHGLASSRG